MDIFDVRLKTLVNQKWLMNGLTAEFNMKFSQVYSIGSLSDNLGIWGQNDLVIHSQKSSIKTG